MSSKVSISLYGCSETVLTLGHKAVKFRKPGRVSSHCLTSVPYTPFHQEQGVMFAALYWEEPDRSGHIFGPDNTTAMGKVLKEV